MRRFLLAGLSAVAMLSASALAAAQAAPAGQVLSQAAHPGLNGAAAGPAPGIELAQYSWHGHRFHHRRWHHHHWYYY
jgi:hypothetical protein